MRLLLSVFLFTAALNGARADALPTFNDFRVEAEYRGPRARPILNTRAIKEFRTRLIDGSRQQPNFAGRYHFIDWGCGTSCAQGAIVNAATGQVTFLPFSICCYVGPMDALDWDSIQFKLSSSLIVFHGQRNEEGVNGDHYYAFDGRAFRFLASKQVEEGAPSAPAPQNAPREPNSPASPSVTANKSEVGTPTLNVTGIPTMFQGTWKLQAGSLTPCSTNQKGDEIGQNTAIIDATSVHVSPDLGRFVSGSVSTAETSSGYAINSMTVQLNYGDGTSDVQTETWSVKDVNGQKVLTILRQRNMSVDLLTKCSS